MEIKDGTATVKEEEVVNYFSTQRSSRMRRIAKLATKTICFTSSITVWVAHFNSKTIENIKDQKDLSYVSLLANISIEHLILQKKNLLF